MEIAYNRYNIARLLFCENECQSVNALGGKGNEFIGQISQPGMNV